MKETLRREGTQRQSHPHQMEVLHSGMLGVIACFQLASSIARLPCVWRESGLRLLAQRWQRCE